MKGKEEARPKSQKRIYRYLFRKSNENRQKKLGRQTQYY